MHSPSYSRQQPFSACIQARHALSKPGSQKRTHHVVLNIRGSNITYAAGDSVGIFPKHDPSLVKKTLEVVGASGEEMVVVKQSGEKWSFSDYLTGKANITDISPKLFREVAARQSNSYKRAQLEELGREEQRATLKAYLSEHEVWDFLRAHEEVSFSAQELSDLLMPLLPRFYSISSSQKWVGEEIHLTVAHFEYEANGHARRGVCSHYLCHLADLDAPTVPLFIQPSRGFGLPQNPQTPLIMIGPGTGVAPFRAFLQERLLHGASKSKHWLFFGERQRAYDFFYEEEWDLFSRHGHLRLDLAFSRDQLHKVYVQDRMLESGNELFQWLEEGAYLYVCGDAGKMAKDVEAALQAIIEKFGKKTEQEAKEYLKLLRQEKRYLRDVY